MCGLRKFPPIAGYAVLKYDTEASHDSDSRGPAQWPFRLDKKSYTITAKGKLAVVGSLKILGTPDKTALKGALSIPDLPWARIGKRALSKAFVISDHSSSSTVAHEDGTMTVYYHERAKEAFDAIQHTKNFVVDGRRYSCFVRAATQPKSEKSSARRVVEPSETLDKDRKATTSTNSWAKVAAPVRLVNGNDLTHKPPGNDGRKVNADIITLKTDIKLDEKADEKEHARHQDVDVRALQKRVEELKTENNRKEGELDAYRMMLGREQKRAEDARADKVKAENALDIVLHSLIGRALLGEYTPERVISFSETGSVVCR